MIDTHFHSLVMQEKSLDPRALLQRAFDNGLEYAVDIGTKADDLGPRMEALSDLSRLFFSAGIYPSFASEERDEELIGILKAGCLTAGERLVAIGECGIDRYWDYAPVRRQQELLIRQIQLADELELPIIIHSRDADEAMCSVLASYRPRCGGVLHCFSSGPEMLAPCLDAGLYISFAGNLTFKNARDIQAAAVQVPLDRLVFETDSPFLTPVPKRGRPNHPQMVEHVYRFFAELRGLEYQGLLEQVRQNVEGLFPRIFR